MAGGQCGIMAAILCSQDHVLEKVWVFIPQNNGIIIEAETVFLHGKNYVQPREPFVLCVLATTLCQV